MRPILVIAALALSVNASGQNAANEMVKTTAVQGGLVVHIGCGDGKLTAALRANDSYLVHGLDADPKQVDAARKHIQSLGVYGRVSVQHWAGGRLPYVDNFVNLVVVGDGAQVTKEELLRVLVPDGVAVFVDGKSQVSGSIVRKPRPDDIDDWTHFLHGPDNNAVAHDRRVDVPRSIQWVSGPRWGRSHEQFASMSAAVTARGRIFFIVDEAPLASIRFTSEWRLVARDAFNGTLLWKLPIGPWVDHLRPFRSGPVHLPRRLVAVGERVYVTPRLDGPVVALDAATGQTVHEYAGTERTEEILAADGILYLVVGSCPGLFGRDEPAAAGSRFIAAIEAETGKSLWKKDFEKGEILLPLTLAVKDRRVYCQTTSGVACLDAQSGQQLWQTARATRTKRSGYSAPTLVATDDVVLLADTDLAGSATISRGSPSTLRAYAAGDGRELWSAPCNEGFNSPVDVFVIGGKVWLGPNFSGPRDLKTGEPLEWKPAHTKVPGTGMGHHRCYREKASERFIFKGKSGIEVWSVDTGWVSNNSWLRGTCQYGILPANGLLYAPPDACACFLTSKVGGFFAAAPQRDATGHMPFPERPVLETGPLYGKLPPAARPVAAGQWPMYRHDAARSGAASTEIPVAAGEVWTAAPGGKLTQPIIVDGRVFVASTDAHTLYALAAGDGRELWRFTAGGRIDSAPTVWKQTVLFGSADGWIYCIGASDGALVWRFRAAPAERLVGVHGQLESIWPVHGAVLVQNDALYAAAGRSSYLDGGIVLYRLDPTTGRELSKTTLYHLDPDTGRQLVPEGNFNMEGVTNDVLSGDGELVFLKHFTFDRDGVRTATTRPHLFSITSLLDDDWFYRSYWVVGQGVPPAGWWYWAVAANTFPSGQILSFDADAVYGYGRGQVAGGGFGHSGDTSYRLFATKRTSAELPARPQMGHAPSSQKSFWTDAQSLVVRAMVLGRGRLAVAGPRDLGQKDPKLLTFTNEPEARAGFEGRKGVYLRIVSAADGATLSECPLPAVPAFDGLAAADGRLYLCTVDGRVLCLVERTDPDMKGCGVDEPTPKTARSTAGVSAAAKAADATARDGGGTGK